MAVHFLLGGSGSGKSRVLQDMVIRRSLEDPAARHIVFVPEQATFTTQQAFIRRHPRHAMLNIEVISFAHLARRVFRELSAETVQVLGENGKRMLLTLAAEDVRSELAVYGGQVSRPGFLVRLGSLFAEWDMNDIAPDRLGAIAEDEEITPLLSAKLKDLCRLYQAFRKRLGNGTVTAEELLPRLVRLLPRSDAAKGAYLWFDGFTGFTGVQYRLITQLIARSRESLFVLTMPEKEAGRAEHMGQEQLFGMSAAALRNLTKCAEEAGKKIGRTFYAEEMRQTAVREEDLAFLESHLMRFDRETYAEKPSRIRLSACRNARTECRAAVLEAMRLAREEGLAWREMAMVVGDQDRYIPALSELLEEAGIPYFTDRRAPLAYHPLIRMTEAALDAVTGNFDRDSVLRFIKNECGPLSRAESDRFENYLLAEGLRGGRKPMTEAYTRLKRLRGEPDGDYAVRKEETLEEMNRLRARIFAPLLDLQETVRGRGQAAAMAGAVLKLLEDLNVQERLARRAEAYEAAGKLREADEWRGVPDAVTAFFTEMQALLGDMPISAQDFRVLAKAGLGALKLGRLPAEPDQLLIGDLERSRMGDIKALLVLGMNEGVIPCAHRTGGIITDRERVLLERFEPDLGYTDERALFEERFYIYRLLTRPTMELWLGYSQVGADGKAIGKSPVIKEIEAMFPLLDTEDFAAVCRRFPVQAVMNRESAARVLAEQIRQRDSGWESLYALLLQDPSFTDRLLKLEQGALLYYRPEALSEEQAEALYGRVLQGNITRLETYVKCAYQHFLRYGLGLEERDEHTWQASDHGTFFHKVMEVILRSLAEEGRRPKELDAAQRAALVKKGINEAATAGEETPLLDKAGSDYLLERWSGLFAAQLKAMGELEPEDGFIPRRFELHFGGGKDALELDLGRGRSMRLGGQIDRLDFWEHDEKTYIRVVDYKTSEHKIDLSEVKEGLQLQLFTYLDAAAGLLRKEGKSVLPGGLYYAVLTDKWQEAGNEDEESLARKRLQSYRLSGMTAREAEEASGDAKTDKNGTVPAEMLRLLCRFVREREIALGKEILRGNIRISPAEGKNLCAYCPYRSDCRYDPRIPGMKERAFPHDKPEEILEELRRAGEGKEAET